MKATHYLTGGLLALIVSVSGVSLHGEDSVGGLNHPLATSERKAITEKWNAVLDKDMPPGTGRQIVPFHSRRGDALFFLGRFADAVKEYQAMVKHDPSLDTSHWRLGIALFFAEQAESAAAQFDKYHAFDDVDRENGIWRYLSQYRARGAETAAAELLRYEKDDREPFPAVYRLFDGSLTPEEALAMIPRNLSASERDKRLFYTELYIGMHLVVQGKDLEAARYLQLATSRKWPRDAGFGPNYMWHVGRVQFEQLQQSIEHGTR